MSTRFIKSYVYQSGQNLGNVKSVSLGPQTITNIVQVSTTEVQVPYPALPPGTYTVTLDNGYAPLTGSVVVDSTGLADQTLAYPSVPIDPCFLLRCRAQCITGSV